MEQKENVRPVRDDRGIGLVEIWPDAWNRFRWPAYQREPNRQRVNQIAKGIREGYDPGPVTVYEEAGFLNIVDGGHRVRAYIRNREEYGIEDPILALRYQAGAIDQNLTFVHENTKLRMNPINIIRADNRSPACALIRMLGNEGAIFGHCADLYDYPVKPLTIVKAALILARSGEDLCINSLAYLSVARAVGALDALLRENERHWDTVLQFLQYELDLWGHEGRHLLNFGVLGFAYFLAKNRDVFFRDGKLVIKSTRTHISQRYGSREIKSVDRSDFGKLAALRARWENWGDQLWINASRDPIRIAIEINTHFWSHRKKIVRVWRPELTL